MRFLIIILPENVNFYEFKSFVASKMPMEFCIQSSSQILKLNILHTYLETDIRSVR